MRCRCGQTADISCSSAIREDLTDGHDFGNINGIYGTVDYQNLMDFTDEVLKRYPMIDPEHLGVAGGSYGGFMTNWIIGHTDRFHAAASQRSISNWVSFEHNSDIGHTFILNNQGSQHEDRRGTSLEAVPTPVCAELQDTDTLYPLR